MQNLTVNVISNGSFRGFPVSADNCIVTVLSNGNAEVTANSDLNVTIY